MPKQDSYKIVLLGDSATGKSCFIVRAVRNEFLDLGATIGAAFYKKQIKLDSNYNIEIWDTAGQEKYRSLQPMYYRNAAGVMVCFDLTKIDTFNGAKSYVREVKRRGHSNSVVFLIGCKLDRDDVREVQYSEAKDASNEFGIEYYETSSLNPELGTSPEQIITLLTFRMRDVAAGVDGGLSDKARIEIIPPGKRHANRVSIHPEMILERNTENESSAEDWPDLIRLDGACSFFNGHKINGLYKKSDKDDEITTPIGDSAKFVYMNTSSPHTLMLIHMYDVQIRRRTGKLLASRSAQYSSWRENSGIFMQWMFFNTRIRCDAQGVLDSYANLVTPLRSKVLGVESGCCDEISEEKAVVDLQAFFAHWDEPLRLGLTIPIFIRYYRLRVFVLRIEFEVHKEAFDFEKMTKVRADMEQMERKCKSLLSSVGEPSTLGLMLPVEYNNDSSSNNSSMALMIAEHQQLLNSEVAELHRLMNSHLKQMCDIKNGNFDVARRCQATIRELEDLRVFIAKLFDKDCHGKEAESTGAKAALEQTDDKHDVENEDHVPKSADTSHYTHDSATFPTEADDDAGAPTIDEGRAIDEGSSDCAEFEMGVILTTRNSDAPRSNIRDLLEGDSSGANEHAKKLVVTLDHKNQKSKWGNRKSKISYRCEVESTQWVAVDELENQADFPVDARCCVCSGISTTRETTIGADLHAAMMSGLTALGVSVEVSWQTAKQQQRTREQVVNVPPRTKLSVEQEVISGRILVLKAKSGSPLTSIFGKKRPKGSASSKQPTAPQAYDFLAADQQDGQQDGKIIQVEPFRIHKDSLRYRSFPI